VTAAVVLFGVGPIVFAPQILSLEVGAVKEGRS